MGTFIKGFLGTLCAFGVIFAIAWVGAIFGDAWGWAATIVASAVVVGLLCVVVSH